MSGNRKNMARFVVMFCITALTSFASIAMAHDAGWDGGQGGNHRQHNFKKLANKLGLTDAQKTQAKAIFQANKEVAKPIYTSLRAERKVLHNLMHADTIDEVAMGTDFVTRKGTETKPVLFEKSLQSAVCYAFR